MSTFSSTVFSDSELHRGVADAMVNLATHAGDHWQKADELGWLIARIGEADDGLGLDADFSADLCMEAGRHLFRGPLRETAVLLPALIRNAECAGELRAVLTRPGIRLGEALAESMRTALVPWADEITHMALLTPKGAALEVRVWPAEVSERVAVQPMDAGTSLMRIIGIDQRQQGEITVVLSPRAACSLMAEMHVATAAELLGISEAVLDRAVAHASTRKQFGAVIGSFQAIKHRLADGLTATLATRLAIREALRHGGSLSEARLARVLAAEAAIANARMAIQIYGGLGFSWETDLHLYLKRAMRLSLSGGATETLRAMAAEEALTDALRDAA